MIIVQIVYLSHSYREPDQGVNRFFSRLMKSEGLLLSVDPPSGTVNTAKLQRHLNANDGMIAVLTQREGDVSPYIRFEIELCLRGRKPLLVFVEDVLPDGLVPARVLQRRFSRGALHRQVREHRHAVTIFRTYLGDEPPPRYQPQVSQRSCAVAGDDNLPDAVSYALDTTLADRGYRIVRASSLTHDEAGGVEALAQADIALTFLDDVAPATHYARGLLHGASVPTIEFTNSDAWPFRANVPREFQPLLLEPPGSNLDPAAVCEAVVEQVLVTEENFLDVGDQDRLERYFLELVDIGSNHGRYSTEDHERIVTVVMGDQYSVQQAGAVGPNSQAKNMSFSQTWNQFAATEDATALAAQLGQLRQHLKETASDAEHDIAIAAIAEAELAAKDGNGPAALERLSGLKRLQDAGKWALAAAGTIGTTIAAAALKVALGL